MRVFLKLLFSHYKAHWFRMLVAAVALSASVAMVVVVGAGYAVTMGSSGEPHRNFLGRFDFVAASGEREDGGLGRGRVGMEAPAAAIDDNVLAWLRERPDIAEMIECCEYQVEIYPAGWNFVSAMHNPGQYIPCSLTGIRSEKPPRELKSGQWFFNNGDDCDDAVLDSGIAQRVERVVGGLGSKGGGRGDRHAESGERPATRPTGPSGGRHEGMRGGPGGPGSAGMFQVATPTGIVQLRIRGVLDTPAGSGLGRKAVYVTSSMFERMTGFKFGVNRVLIAMKEGADRAAFKADFENFVSKAKYSAYLQTREDYEPTGGMMRKGGDEMDVMKYAGAILAPIAAMFIIFNTFSMGVQERIRQLAILRTVGMTRGQVGRLIVFEAMQLAVVGWVAGLAAGWWAVRYNMGAGGMGGFGMRSTVNFTSVAVMAAVVAFGATLVAALIPAWLAGRKRPLDAVTSSMFYESGRWAWWLPVIGLPMVLLNPLLTFTRIVPDAVRLPMLPLSLFTTMIGFAMISPLIILTFGRLFNLAIGALFGLDRRFLKRHYAAGKWQTIGCFVAMMVGMGLFVVVQTWGSTMLKPYQLAKRSPDASVTVFPDGIPIDRAGEVKDIKGIEKSVPMIVRNPELDEAAYGGSLKNLMMKDMLYIGCDVPSLLGGDGMTEATFVRGSEADAFEALKHGGCIITESLYIKSPELFDVGKTIEMETVDVPHRKMSHRIAGVVSMPGWHLLTMSARMRRGLSLVAGVVFVSEASAVADFPSAGYKTFWLKLAPGVKPADMEKPFIALAEKIRKENADPIPASALGRPYCHITDTAAMTAAINRRADSIIRPMTRIPLIAISLGALAIASTLVVSIHARSWDIGIMRSIGLDRWQLVRQILAEGIVICLLACVISLMFGLLIAWTFAIIAAERMGVSISFVIPWDMLFLGLGVAVASSLAACLWPAVVAARKQPLDLLQTGRSNE